MADAERSFIPAAGHDLLLPFYDPLQRVFGVESIRQRLLEQAAIQAGHRLLDIGCGTGSLVVQLERLYPEAEVVGLDPDPKALTRAERKTARAGVSVQLDRGFSDELPYPDASFDRVLSSFMFHHLKPAEKEATLHETRRVLRPGGSLHVLDLGRDAPGDRMPLLMAKAGLTDAREIERRRTIFGRVVYWRATR